MEEYLLIWQCHIIYIVCQSIFTRQIMIYWFLSLKTNINYKLSINYRFRKLHVEIIGEIMQHCTWMNCSWFVLSCQSKNGKVVLLCNLQMKQCCDFLYFLAKTVTVFPWLFLWVYSHHPLFQMVGPCTSCAWARWTWRVWSRVWERAASSNMLVLFNDQPNYS